MMQNLFLYLLAACLLLTDLAFASEIDLLKIRKSDSRSSTQIYLTFSELPAFTHVHNGKRIDVILDAVLSNTEPMEFPVDDKVVKFLTQDKESKTVLTFFLRYEPQQVKLSLSRENTLVIDILLGNEFTKAYPELTSKLQGLSIVDQKSDNFANPYISNPYADNWRSFFSQYEPEIVTSAPLKFTSPPFPIIDLIPDGNSSTLLPVELFTLSAQELWKDMLPLLLELIDTVEDQETKKKLALTFGETLFRAADYQNAYRQLYLLKENYADEYVGIAAAYLLAQLRAEHEDPYTADFQYRELEEHISDRFALSPFILLSQIETALATNQLERADTLLRKDDIAFPPRLKKLRELRQADYWFAAGSYVKAYVGYRLFDDENILDTQPSSLNGYCDGLYRQKSFREAAQCYYKLSSILSDKKYLGLISLKKAMAELHYKSAREMYVIFSTLEDTYADTEVGYRAAVKKTDIRYLSQPSWRKTSVQYYRALVEKGANREVAEEAALKEAIVYFELGDNEKSIELLLDFLRIHHAGTLKPIAQALLIELLPHRLEKMLADNSYVEAIILAKKNRELFRKNWIDVELLSLLAKAYYELGIFDEAGKLYLYLLGTAEQEAKEGYFLPLLSILNAQGNHDLVEDYVTQYTYNFPNGTDKEAISLIHLQSLIADGKNDMALALLSSPLPDNHQAKEIAATLFFSNDMYDKTIEVLDPLWKSGELQSEDLFFMLAESLFQEDSRLESEQLFLRVKENEKFHDQSRYRLAIIEQERGATEKSLKLFKEIVEKGYDPLWRKLAQKELEFNEIEQQF